MKTHFSIITVIIVILILLLSVSCTVMPDDKSDTPLPSSTTEQTEKPYIPTDNKSQVSDVMIYYADLTHDGSDEKILVDFSELEIAGSATVWVYVYDSNDKLLWKDSAGLSHAGNNEIYLYKENENYYLITWSPYVMANRTDFRYNIFSLSSAGDVILYKGGAGDFLIDDDEDILPGPDGRKKEANEFIQEVNKYLENSFVLVATSVDYGVIYSTPDNHIIHTTKLYE